MSLSLPTRALITLVRLYQMTAGHWLGGRCRFRPTCSNYAIDALRIHGAWRGLWLSIRRVMRCHPWGRRGFDPVPDPSRGEPTAQDDEGVRNPRPRIRKK